MLTRLLAATCSAIAEFNQGIESTVARTFDVMGMTVGSQTKLSAVKADKLRLEKARQQVKDSSREARHAKAMARVHHDSDYEPGGIYRRKSFTDGL